MSTNHEQAGRFSQHARGLGTVTEKMVRERAAELALANGRPPGQVLDVDIQEARRELTGAETLVPNPTPAEELTEDQRWEPVPASTGKKAPTKEATDEQTFAEKLVDEGLEDAEQDNVYKATRQSQRRDRRNET